MRKKFLGLGAALSLPLLQLLTLRAQTPAADVPKIDVQKFTLPNGLEVILSENHKLPMVAVDVWGSHPPSRAGALYRGVDAVAETDYTGWYDSPRASVGQQVALMRARLSAMHRTFAGKVLLISEFGAESNTLNPPGAPGSYSFQASLLARHIGVYAADRGLSGMFIWDLRDYPLIPGFQGGSIHDRLPRVRIIEGLIQKGLFTYAGAPKPAVRTVARMFRGLPAG